MKIKPSPLPRKALSSQLGKAQAKPDTTGIPQDTVSTGNPSQAQRITRFVEEKKLEATDVMRQAGGLIAGQLTGMTLGSIVFAPLALSLGNLYVATGGAALTGAALAWGGSKLAEKDPTALMTSKLANGAAALGAVANSLPKIAYPTLVGATAHQKELFYGALDQLPLGGVTSVPTVDMVSGLEAVGASGLATPLLSHNRIFLDVDQMNISDHWAREVLVHEVGHTYDFSKGVGPIFNRSFGKGYGKEPFISNYAQTNRMEDYAESYAHYHLDADHLQSVAPGKFAELEASQAPGVVDKALDRPGVRNAGRKIGTAFEGAPRARNLLALGAGLVGPIQLYRGAALYQSGLATGDAVSRLNGKLNLAAGIALLGPGTAPLSAILAAGQAYTNHQLGAGAISAQDAEKRADLALAISAGPIGAIGSSVLGELSNAGLFLGSENRATLGPVRPLEESTVEHLNGGFALGAALGGLISPFLLGGGASTHAKIFAAAGGAWLGGGLGAAAGGALKALRGPITRTRVSSSQAQSPSDPFALTSEDKSLLGKLTGTTVLGGGLGAFGGYHGGRTIGRLVGQALGGAPGAVSGAALGSYLGLLGGSFALAKGGAKLGAKWAGLSSQSSKPKDEQSKS